MRLLYKNGKNLSADFQAFKEELTAGPTSIGSDSIEQ